MNIRHRFVSAKADSADPTLVQPSNWNADHDIINFPFTVSTDYIFTAQTGGAGNLSVGLNVITLTPVPLGVNGSDRVHYLYISGGAGTAEPVLITGGTAVSGASSGTVIVSCANTHTGAWSIQSASAGIREALSAGIVAGRGCVYVPPANNVIHGQLYFPPTNSFHFVCDADLTFGADIGANDGIWIDSCESCVYEFNNSIFYAGSGNAVRLNPHNPSPFDGIRNIQWTRFFWNNVQSAPPGGAPDVGIPIAQSNFLIQVEGNPGPPNQGLISHNSFTILSAWGALSSFLVSQIGTINGGFEENLLNLSQMVLYTQLGVRTCGTDFNTMVCPNNIWNINVVFSRDDGTGTAAQSGLSLGQGTINNIINLGTPTIAAGKKHVIFGAGSQGNHVTSAIGSSPVIDDVSGNRSNEITNLSGQSIDTDISSLFPGGGPNAIYQNTSNRPLTVVVAANGNTSAINLSANGSNFRATGETSGQFMLRQGEAIQLVYTTPPTVRQFIK